MTVRRRVASLWPRTWASPPVHHEFEDFLYRAGWSEFSLAMVTTVYLQFELRRKAVALGQKADHHFTPRGMFLARTD